LKQWDRYPSSTERISCFLTVQVFLATSEQAGKSYGDVDMVCGFKQRSFVLFTVYCHFLITDFSVILKSLDDLISSRFVQIKSQIKSQIFKMISNQIKSPKFDLDHEF